MSSAFLDTSRIPVTDGDGNTIYLRRKMDFGTKSRFLDALAGVGMAGAGSYKLLLAEYNFLEWSGPLFGGEPCTAENIRRLDPDLPLLVEALNKIAELNPTRRSPRPNEVGASGLPTAGAPSSPASSSEPATAIPSMNGISTSF